MPSCMRIGPVGSREAHRQLAIATLTRQPAHLAHLTPAAHLNDAHGRQQVSLTNLLAGKRQQEHRQLGERLSGALQGHL